MTQYTGNPSWPWLVVAIVLLILVVFGTTGCVMPTVQLVAADGSTSTETLEIVKEAASVKKECIKRDQQVAELKARLAMTQGSMPQGFMGGVDPTAIPLDVFVDMTNSFIDVWKMQTENAHQQNMAAIALLDDPCK